MVWAVTHGPIPEAQHVETARYFRLLELIKSRADLRGHKLKVALRDGEEVIVECERCEAIGTSGPAIRALKFTHRSCRGRPLSRSDHSYTAIAMYNKIEAAGGVVRGRGSVVKHDQRNHFLLAPSLQRRGGAKFAAPVFLCAFIVVAFLALPAGVWARGLDARKQPGTSAEFTVSGTNGYSLNVKSEKGTVTIVAADQRPPVATISATGDIRPANNGNVAASTYFTAGSPRNPNVIEADLGSLGTISVTFQPSGKTRVTRVNLKNKTKKCVGAERIVRHLGTFTGSIKFQGEGSYTTVDLPSAEGTVGTSIFRNCSTKVSHRGGRTQTSSSDGSVFLIASSRSDLFIASTCGPSTCFYANSVEILTKDVIVVRSAQAFAGKSSFAFDDALNSARLTPPAPFSGRGSFRDGPGESSSWSGSLQAAFPGVTVPLTGPSFKAKLRRDG
jgi:hypothetical protein